MSPEQVAGNEADHRSDIFSLGCVLYEMISGRKAFDRETTPETMAAILKEEPTDLSASGEALPAELVGAVRRCLEKQPQSRFQSASDLAYNLRSISSASTPSVDHALRRGGALRRAAPWAGAGAMIVVAAVALLMWPRLRVPPADTPPDQLKRIVVLPFENLGPPEDEYFAAGMTEEITSRLAAVSGLRVISRTSAKAYAGTTKQLREIGRELDVGFVVEGTVRWDRDAAGLGRVRITPQLIRVADDTHLWSERYDRLLEDVFTIQSDIAAQVIDQLQATLLEPERRAIEARPTDNMEAYQSYLLALQYWWIGEAESTATLMLELLKRAVELDPEFALAHGLLSRAHSQFYHYKYDFTADRQSLARRSAERALELQPDLAEAHLAFAFYHYWCHRDYDAALAEIAIAEQGQPNDPDVLTAKWAVSRRMGRWQEAVETLERMLAIDPQGYLTLYETAATLTMMRQFERADEYLQRAIAIAPDRPDAYYYAALNYLQWDGTTDRTRTLLSGVPTLDDPRLVYLSLLLDIYDRDHDALLAGIAELEDDAISLVTAFHPKELLQCDALDRADEHERARPSCESAVSVLMGELERRPYDQRLYGALGQAYVMLGRDQDAVTSAERAAEMWPVSKDAFEGSSTAIELAKIYARVGDHDRAIDRLEELLAIPCNLSVPLLRLDPDWDPLRDHPRFQKILEKYREEE
jgi:TolB-like protein/Flp pilus assembly protein TadD